MNQLTMALFPPLIMQGAHPAHGVPGASLSGVPMGIHLNASPARNVRTGQGLAHPVRLA